MTANAADVRQCRGLMNIVSKWHGQYYASVIALADEKTVARIAILGPYATEQEADAAGDKAFRTNSAQMQRGETVTMVDTRTVPSDARRYISHSVAAHLQQYGSAALGGKVFGEPLN